MEKIITAEEFKHEFSKLIPLGEELMHFRSSKKVSKVMIEFAKLHVEAALKEASENVFWNIETRESYFGDTTKDERDFESTGGDAVPYELHRVVINKNSILNSYPLDKIK